MQQHLGKRWLVYIANLKFLIVTSGLCDTDLRNQYYIA